jgi:UDP-N-acetylglucosamine 2-epimerase (non-hydrolysing)
MSPIIREFKRRDLDFYILHTGQHYSHNLDRVFFEQLELPKANFNLEVGSGTHGEQTGKMLAGIEQILLKERPDVVLVQGDTNTVLAGALAASKLAIRVGHVEAGLRSYDRYMPEEINRVLADHCSDYLFAPTENSLQILLNEGISEEKVYLTGNTIVDAVYENVALAKRKNNVLEKLGLESEEYILTTVHRQENVDDKERFSNILRGLEHVSDEFGLPVVYPIHPRSKKMLTTFGFTPKINLVETVDFLSFLQLEKRAKLILTDSGGVQEEACILKTPCVTLRDNTERPETVDVGANIVAGTDPLEILTKARIMIDRKRNWGNPFGDGKAASKIVTILMKK